MALNENGGLSAAIHNSRPASTCTTYITYCPTSMQTIRDAAATHKNIPQQHQLLSQTKVESFPISATLSHPLLPPLSIHRPFILTPEKHVTDARMRLPAAASAVTPPRGRAAATQPPPGRTCSRHCAGCGAGLPRAMSGMWQSIPDAARESPWRHPARCR